MKTQAAILVELGKPLEVVELGIPALKPGQVLVEIAFSGACHTQVLEARGHRGADPFVPHCLGHEGSGTVLEVGAGVTKVAPGDTVILSWIKGSGANVPGSVYDWSGRPVNAGGVTTFMRHAVVAENRVTRLMAGLDLKTAIMLGCALPTGFGAVVNTASPGPGQSIAIFGAGGVGQSAIMGAVASGCAPVIAVDPNPAKRELALRFGANHVIDPAAGDPVAEIQAITGGGADVAIEATGLPAVMVQAARCVRPQGGKAVIVGNARHGENVTFDPRLFNDGKSVLGTWGGDSVPDRDYPRFARLIAAGRINVEPLLSAPYRLEEINAVLDDLEAGRVGRPVIDMSL
ncbi:zinc-binding dehydrogenase [Azospirillum halopraeferens]|uniref:zinc-binding dehydrogenase n=1 Tax=Azospirillum halopraeferens TaxID=34010 RepID=UPI000417C6FD|nr:zinc-binding dehydrogenase [Azospirillum halopraeferens]